MKKLLAVLLLLVVYPAYGQDYTVTPIEVRPPLENMNITGGTNLNLADDGMANNINIGFDFEFYGNIFNTVNISNNGFITFTGFNSACCQGQLLPSPFMDNSIMALWTDLISVNNVNPYYKIDGEFGSRYFTVGWYNTLEFYNPDATNTFEITLYEGSNNILFNYENLHVFGHALTAGIQGTDGQYEQLYYGDKPLGLAYSAYLFEYTPPEPEDPIAPDCTVNPTYIDCLIDNTPDPIYIVDDNTSNDEDDINVAETIEPDNEQSVIGGEVDLEDLLALNDDEDEEELLDEDEEEELSDEISTDVLEQALATTEFLQDGSSDRERNTSRGLSDEKDSIVESVVDNIEIETLETVVENNETKEVVIEENIIETEKILVIENTETETKEEITVEESTTSVTVEQSLVSIEQEIPTETVTEELETVQLPVFVQSTSETIIENISLENIDGTVDSETFVANQVEQAIQLDNEITNEVITNTITQAVEETLFVENIVTETLQQQQKTFTEEQTDEQLTMEYVQPGVFASITPFNVEPNVADKEASGVLGKVEEKSDAEKRAEEVVAANKEQQDEINKNYMEADQSGIVAAMGADTDVNAYRSRMLNDNNIWYKPEDIYKNVVYKDNVRGAYFLEKGNTDTYKKMIEEQYK